MCKEMSEWKKKNFAMDEPVMKVVTFYVDKIADKVSEKLGYVPSTNWRFPFALNMTKEA